MFHLEFSIIFILSNEASSLKQKAIGSICLYHSYATNPLHECSNHQHLTYAISLLIP